MSQRLGFKNEDADAIASMKREKAISVLSDNAELVRSRYDDNDGGHSRLNSK